MYDVRKIVITGGVAVGKSTIVDQVKKSLESSGKTVILVPEYIDVKPDGLEMLNKYLTKEIKTYVFQKYIMDYYDEYLTALEVDTTNNNTVLLFERSLDDSVSCFSNLDHTSGTLSTEEFYSLYCHAKEVDNRHGIPSFFLEPNYVFFPVKTEDPVKDGNLIAAIIENRLADNIIIGLYNSDVECLHRVHKRNRRGEIEAYPLPVIEKFNSNYRRLYQLLMNGGNLKFTDLGKLVN